MRFLSKIQAKYSIKADAVADFKKIVSDVESAFGEKVWPKIRGKAGQEWLEVKTPEGANLVFYGDKSLQGNVYPKFFDKLIAIAKKHGWNDSQNIGGGDF